MKFNTTMSWSLLSGKMARKEVLTEEEIQWLADFEARIAAYKKLHNIK